jgi:hypothetical protein
LNQASTVNTGNWAATLVSGAELGPPFLRPDGRVFYIGATSDTALYTPPALAGNATGTWAAGPTIPLGLGANDAPGAVLPNGHVLFAASATPGFGPGSNTINPVPVGTSLFEYDPASNTINAVTNLPANLRASLSGVAAFVTRMLVLPSGQLLISDSTGQPYLYTPAGGPDPSWRPAVDDIKDDGDGSFTLTGTQLNGLSEGAAYGDDAQMATNYPIIRLTQARDFGLPLGVRDAVTYARTYNWSSSWVATGSTPVSTQFNLPAGTAPGVYRLEVVANGIASRPVLLVVGSGSDDTVDVGIDSVLGVPVDHYVTLNGTKTFFDPGQFSGIDVITEGGVNTVNVKETTSGVPVTITGGGTDAVNVGDESRVAGIGGDVNINDGPNYATITVDDSLDGDAHGVTLGTSSHAGQAGWVSSAACREGRSTTDTPIPGRSWSRPAMVATPSRSRASGSTPTSSATARSRWARSPRSPWARAAGSTGSPPR